MGRKSSGRKLSPLPDRRVSDRFKRISQQFHRVSLQVKRISKELDLPSVARNTAKGTARRVEAVLRSKPVQGTIGALLLAIIAGQETAFRGAVSSLVARGDAPAEAKALRTLSFIPIYWHQRTTAARALTEYVRHSRPVRPGSPCSNDTLSTELRTAVARIGTIGGKRRATLYRTDIPAVYMDRADIPNADFSSACLSGSSMRAATLDSAVFVDAHLETAQLSGSWMNYAIFTGAILKRATLQRARGKNVSFYKAELAFADLTGAHLPKADFSYSDLRCATMVGDTLDEADFTASDLSGADLSGAHLDDVKGLLNLKAADKMFLRDVRGLDAETLRALEQRFSLARSEADLRQFCGSM